MLDQPGGGKNRHAKDFRMCESYMITGFGSHEIMRFMATVVGTEHLSIENRPPVRDSNLGPSPNLRFRLEPSHGADPRMERSLELIVLTIRGITVTEATRAGPGAVPLQRLQKPPDRGQPTPRPAGEITKIMTIEVAIINQGGNNDEL
jgi:hypothetical protein